MAPLNFKPCLLPRLTGLHPHQSHEALLARDCISNFTSRTPYNNGPPTRQRTSRRCRDVARRRLFSTTNATRLAELTRPATSSAPRILIVGAGPAGCTTAYFLAKAGFEVTIAERSTRPPYGQGIDITNQAVDVVKRMDLLEKIKANTTGETGFALLDDAGKQVGSLLGTNDAQYETQAGGPTSLTNEIEVYSLYRCIGRPCAYSIRRSCEAH